MNTASAMSSRHGSPGAAITDREEERGDIGKSALSLWHATRQSLTREKRHRVASCEKIWSWNSFFDSRLPGAFRFNPQPAQLPIGSSRYLEHKGDRLLNRELFVLNSLHLDPAGAFFRLGEIVLQLQPQPYF